jgi:hypothetical protein
VRANLVGNDYFGNRHYLLAGKHKLCKGRTWEIST